MCVDHASECLSDMSCDTVAANECVDVPETPTPAHRAARADGRSRRPRFGAALDDALNDTPPRPATGSIAISFAVVSRRNWPR
ncbi:hypothetical protein DIE14_17150 [Burkholderia sp. Bp9017]|nr:hypothetical protein DIE14_17150 [Burkholderia sp. Bp9017]RQZ33338.1 hypothetical protein DIE13_17060 [Burkholderia sp. Bp9016]